MCGCAGEKLDLTGPSAISVSPSGGHYVSHTDWRGTVLQLPAGQYKIFNTETTEEEGKTCVWKQSHVVLMESVLKSMIDSEKRDRLISFQLTRDHKLITLSDRSLQIHDSISYETLHTITMKASTICLNTDNTQIVSVCNDESESSTISVWDILSGKEGFSFTAETHHVSHIVTIGKYLIGTGEGMMSVWELHTGRRLQTLSHLYRVVQLAISPDRNRMVTLDMSGALSVWRWADFVQVCVCVSISRVCGCFYLGTDFLLSLPVPVCVRVTPGR